MSPNRIVAALLTGLLLSGLTGGCAAQQKGVDFTATVVDPPFTVSPVPLTTTDGASMSLAARSDTPLTLVFFGYTRCPDICSAVMASLTSGLQRLGDADRKDVRVVFVTTDPKRDTGPQLRRYLDRFDDSFIGLTGSLPDISRVGRSVGVFVDKGEKLASGGYDPNSHGTYVVAVDASGKAPDFWGMDTSPSQYADDIAFMLNGRT